MSLTGFERFKARCDAYAEVTRAVVSKPAASCWLWHRWGRWEQINRVRNVFCADKQWHATEDAGQRRQCARCHYVQVEWRK